MLQHSHISKAHFSISTVRATPARSICIWSPTIKIISFVFKLVNFCHRLGSMSYWWAWLLMLVNLDHFYPCISSVVPSVDWSISNWGKSHLLSTTWGIILQLVRDVPLHRRACDIEDLFPPVYRKECMSWECTLSHHYRFVSRKSLSSSLYMHSWKAIDLYYFSILFYAPLKKIIYSNQALHKFWTDTNLIFIYTLQSALFLLIYLWDDPRKVQYFHALTP